MRLRTKIQLNFNNGFAGRRLLDAMLKFKPWKVKLDDFKPDISLEFLVGNPYSEPESYRETIKRIENKSIKKIYWLFYSCANDQIMPEHFRNAKAIISPFPSIKKDYPETIMLPLGADPDTFYKSNAFYNKEYIVHTHGYDLRAESIKYVHIACKELKLKQCHIGSDFNSLNNQSGDILDNQVIFIDRDISDERMRYFYNKSYFIAGLRLLEGFEMPIIEGAMCGCRPITYDLPCYRKWFSDFAAFIPFVGEPEKDGPPFGTSEQRTEKLITSIQQVFNEYSCLSTSQIEYVKDAFSWDRIIPKVWNIILE